MPRTYKSPPTSPTSGDQDTDSTLDVSIHSQSPEPQPKEPVTTKRRTDSPCPIPTKRPHTDPQARETELPAPTTCRQIEVTKENISVSIRGKQVRTCPVCHIQPPTNLRRHVHQSHLPWFTDPLKVCWHCLQAFAQNTPLKEHSENCQEGNFRSNTHLWAPLLMEMFTMLAEGLKLKKLEDLVPYVQGLPQSFPSPNAALSSDDQAVMRLLCLYGHKEIPKEFKCSPPNSFAALLQWRILSHLLYKVPLEVRTRIFNIQVGLPTASQELSDIPPPRIPKPTRNQELSDIPPPRVPKPTRNQELSDIPPPRVLRPVENQELSDIPPPRVPRPLRNASTPIPSIFDIQVKAPPATTTQHRTVAATQRKEDSEKTKSSVPSKPFQGSAPRGVDAHFHPEKLVKKSQMSLEQSIRQQSWETSFYVERVFPCYAFPKSWPSAVHVDSLPLHANRVAWGWHPTRFADFKEEKYKRLFQICLRDRHIVATGEVGLDYARNQSPSDQSQQAELLNFCCQETLQRNLPLLIHCRDLPGRNDAMEDCLAILKQNLPKGWLIYLHCYNYGLAELCRWLQSFPNVVLGISPKALDPTTRHPQLIEVIKCLEDNRLLLETDSPYLYPACLKDEFPFGCPAMVLPVAQQVAQWRSTEVDHVLKEAMKATYHFYRC